MASLNQVATRLEVSRLAQGVFDRRAEEFITDRERQIATNVPEQNRQYLEQVRQARQRSSSAFRGIRTFEDVLSAFNDDLPRLAQTVLPVTVTVSEARQMVLKEAEFPALRAAMRANLYLTFIQIVHQAQPGADRIDDLRNVVDASYCAAFVSAG